MDKEHQTQGAFFGVGNVTIRPFQIKEDGTKNYFPVTKNNLIVEKGRSSLIDLMTGEKDKQLKYIRWGKGGAKQFPDGDPLIPLPVDDKDISVKTFLIDKPLGPYNRKSLTQVEYTEVLICDEVDSDVNEAAMMFEEAGSLSRTIFARVTFPTARLTIEAGTGLEIKWVFNFSKSEETLLSYEEPAIQTDPSE